MRPLVGFLAITLGLATMAPLPARADAMHCGIHWIQGGGRHGPKQYEVLKKCGQPLQRRANIWVYKVDGKLWELRFSSEGILETVKRRS